MCATLEEAKAYGLLVEVYIHEKKIDLALANYERARNVGNRGFRFRFTPLALQLARAAEESPPGHAVQLYVEEAETEIAHRSRDNYATAATYLARTKSLYARMGTPEKWAETVQRIRAAHKNLPAMKDEFNRAGLP